MGYNVVFWSPVPGQTGSTSNLIAVSALLGLEYSSRILLLGSAQSQAASLERALVKRRDDAGSDPLYADIGVDALERLIRNNKLLPEMLRDYTIPLLKERFDFLPGTIKPHKTFAAGAHDFLPQMLLTAKRYYDLILIDAGSGARQPLSQMLLQNADAVVVSLNQNLSVLERFFAQNDWQQWLSGKPLLLVLGQYDRYSVYTTRNIKRRFKLKSPLYQIAHSAGLMDAMQEGRVIDFMFRNQSVPKGHEHHFLMQGVRILAQALIEQAGLNKPYFGGKGE
ncbi:hypothetical protein B5M42_020940 [Paenibacillus athensensis]|uniref:AAA domain-containing protein n=2 Tax=Paenibacillus athensensis TaxID=1967502 RepID=A0A4Y8PYS4_9BACL|nr:hypothetical protein [Paenibacillus athensensis]